MEKLILENGESKEIIEWRMNVSLTARLKDLKHNKETETDIRINYLLERLQTHFVNHGFATDYFEKEGEVDLGKLGTVRYKLTPVVESK